MIEYHGSKTVPAEQHAGSPMELLRSGIRGAFFRPVDAEQVGVPRRRLAALVAQGALEHVERGLYRFADAEPTERYSIAMACARVPRAIVCLLSALVVHEIGTQLPWKVWLAIPHRAEPPRVRGIQVELVRFSGAAATYGVLETHFEGVPARITSPARTIVDCFRYERLLGPEAPMEALTDGLRQRKATVAELSRILQVLPSRRLAAALDVRSI